MRKEKIVGIILDEVVRDKDGKVIATKEIVNEIIFNGHSSECITREIIKLGNGRIVINQVLYRSEIKKTNQYNSINLLTGLVEGGA